MAALSRMSSGTHRKVTITPRDVVIFSSSPIPGNEKAVYRVINELSMMGAKVIFQDTHVSGHACQEEIKLMYALIHPKFSIPVHGEHRHRMAQAQIAQAMDIPKENIFMINSGDVLCLNENEGKIVDTVTHGDVLVDGLGVGDVGNIVIKDRQALARDGIIVVALALESYSNQLIAGPDIVSRGFVYVKESEDLLEEARVVALESVQRNIAKNVTDWNKIKSDVRDELGEFIWKKIKRNPMILPIIQEV